MWLRNRQAQLSFGNIPEWLIAGHFFSTGNLIRYIKKSLSFIHAVQNGMETMHPGPQQKPEGVLMKKAIFFVAIALAVVMVVLGVLYMLPYVPHPFLYSSKESVVRTPHHFYAALSFLLTVIFAAIAFLFRPKRQASGKTGIA